MKDAGRAVALTLSVTLLFAVPALGASIVVEPETVVLGRVESARVTLTVDEAPGTEDRPLRLSVNVGSFGQVTRLGPGKYRSVYVAPTTRFPQLALVAVWRETGVDAPIEFLRIPLYGTTRIPVTAAPGAEARIKVGTATFGPVSLDSKGHGTLAVEVPPGVHEATLLVKERNGLENQKVIPVEVPPYNRLTAALVPHAIRANGAETARLVVFYDLDGAHVSADKLSLDASLGSATLESAQRGRYVYRYLPPGASSQKEVRFDVTVKNDLAAHAAMQLALGLPPADKVVVRPPEKALPCDGKTTAPVYALVFDAAGLGLADQKLEVTADGVALPPFRYKGNGLYEGRYTSPSAYPAGGLVQFAAKVATASGPAITGGTNYQVQAVAVPKALNARLVPDPVPVGVTAPATLWLDVRDAAGLPLDDAHLILVASDGVLGPLEPSGDGQYRSTYTAPAALPPGPAFARVVDSTGAFETRVDLPLRADPHRLLAGVRAGFTHSLGDLKGLRYGLDVAVPVHPGGSTVLFDASVMFGSASQTVTDASGELQSLSTATFFPATLRLAYELYAGRRLGVLVGVGGVATYARFNTSLTQDTATRWGFGGLGFLQGTFAAGPGQVFADVSYSVAAVDGASYHLEAGGVAVELGYRFGVL